MKRTGFVSIALLAVACLCGCGGITADFVQTKSFTQGSRSPDQIEIFLLGDAPDRPHEIVGTISTYWYWQGLDASRQEVVRALRVEASRWGLDGVRDIRFAGAGTIGEGLAAGTGFVYED